MTPPRAKHIIDSFQNNFYKLTVSNHFKAFLSSQNTIFDSVKFELLSPKHRSQCIDLQCNAFGYEKSSNYFTKIAKVSCTDFYCIACNYFDVAINNGISFVMLNEYDEIIGVQMSNDAMKSIHYPKETIKEQILYALVSEFIKNDTFWSDIITLKSHGNLSYGYTFNGTGFLRYDYLGNNLWKTMIALNQSLLFKHYKYRMFGLGHPGSVKYFKNKLQSSIKVDGFEVEISSNFNFKTYLKKKIYIEKDPLFVENCNINEIDLKDTDEAMICIANYQNINPNIDIIEMFQKLHY
eukprot:12245_1